MLALTVLALIVWGTHLGLPGLACSAMTREQVLALVRERGVALGVAMGALPETTRFAEDLGLDSLSLVEWALSLEEVFDVELPEEQVTSVETIGALVDLLLSQLDL